jgi:exosome complex RNA-binding protein Csl4
MTILRNILFIFGLVVFANTGYAQEPSATPAHPAGAQIVTGEVLKIEGETYVIRDAFGKEVRLRVDQNSKIEGSPKVGDRVEAKVLEGGWASILSKR